MSKDSKDLWIFLSHKKGDAERNARQVAGALALFGGTSVKIICSANFERGEEWEPKIREGLAKSHWLVLLYTGPHTDWDWCLYETGYFRALMDKEPDRRLICLHDPNFPVPAPLRGINHVPAIEADVEKLFEDIYKRKPWELNPDIFENNLDAVKDAIKRVCLNCRFGSGPKDNRRITPLINIRVKKTDLAMLDQGTIPGASPVTGEGSWETLFGKPEATAGWTWNDLVESVVNIAAWEYQLAAMMSEATNHRSVHYPSIAVRILIRGSEDRQKVYRIGLARVSEYEVEVEFVFIASRIRTPFEPSADDNETMLYHLFNMAWHFRRRFVEFHRSRMEDLSDVESSMRNSGHENDFKRDLREAVKNIRIDLSSLEADAQVRGLDRSTSMRRAFAPADRAKLDQLLNIEWPPLYTKLLAEIQKDEPKAQAIRDIFIEMDPVNKWFCQRSMEQLARIADKES
jgi:hypothetical protein